MDQLTQIATDTAARVSRVRKANTAILAGAAVVVQLADRIIGVVASVVNPSAQLLQVNDSALAAINSMDRLRAEAADLLSGAERAQSTTEANLAEAQAQVDAFLLGRRAVPTLVRASIRQFDVLGQLASNFFPFVQSSEAQLQVLVLIEPEQEAIREEIDNTRELLLEADARLQILLATLATRTPRPTPTATPIPSPTPTPTPRAPSRTLSPEQQANLNQLVQLAADTEALAFDLEGLGDLGATEALQSLSLAQQIIVAVESVRAPSAELRQAVVDAMAVTDPATELLTLSEATFDVFDAVATTGANRNLAQTQADAFLFGGDAPTLLRTAVGPQPAAWPSLGRLASSRQVFLTFAELLASSTAAFESVQSLDRALRKSLADFGGTSQTLFALNERVQELVGTGRSTSFPVEVDASGGAASPSARFSY